MKKILLLIVFTTVIVLADWWGGTPSPIDLHMTDTDAGLFYGFLGLICGYSLIHHFRSF